jgi:hypothetical protein
MRALYSNHALLLQNMLEGMPSLNSLELEDCSDIGEKHIMQMRLLTQVCGCGGGRVCVGVCVCLCVCTCVAR